METTKWVCKNCRGTWIYRLGIVEQYINEDHENILIFNEPSDKEYHCNDCVEYIEIVPVQVTEVK
tara:strand:+ start:1239 stop:1433 length:195 start_codon:yes stop_codon:yes gene_type:complete